MEFPALRGVLAEFNLEVNVRQSIDVSGDVSIADGVDFEALVSSPS
jgi:hypothetical protein